MSRVQLTQMYIDIYGEENVNEMWLATMTDDEIITVITAHAKLGKLVGDNYKIVTEAVIRTSVATARRMKEEGK